MTKKISFRKQRVGNGYIIERKHLKKWKGVNKQGEISDEIFVYRNDYIADMQVKHFEQSTEILPTDIIGGDTELQVD